MKPRLFLELLLLLLVGLKLGGLLDWSWWWVLTPLWAPTILAVVGYSIYGIAWLCMSDDERKRRRVVRALERYSDALSRRTR